MNIKYFLLIVLAIAFTERTSIYSQQEFSLGSTVKYNSKIFGGEVSYFVHLPEGYENSNKKYPVIFMLNGHYLINIANSVAAIDYLSNDRIPDMVFIGIMNTGIAADTKSWPDSAGNVPAANKFGSFIEKELLPEIEKNYRVNNFRILMGQSNSGLFALHMFLHKTDLFKAYIISSPMLGWNPEYFSKSVKEFFGSVGNSNKLLYIPYGDLDYPEVLNHIGQFKEILNSQAPAGLKWKIELIENAGHVPYIALHNALLFFFSELTMTPERKKLSINELKSHFKKLSDEFGFEIVPKGDALLEMAVDLKNEKRFDEAINTLNYLVYLYPKSALYFYVLGLAQFEKGDFDSAKISISQALKIDPKFYAAESILKKIDMKANNN